MRIDKLSKRDRQELILDLVYGFVLCRKIDDAITFLEDLITKKELEMLSRRLRIAKLLLESYGYRDIQNIVHVSHATIAKISSWLSEKGEGFRRIIKKLPKREEPKDPLHYSMWEDLKRRYPSYFLPELIIEDLISKKEKRDKIKISKSLENLENSLRKKKDLYEEISEQFRKR